MNEILHWPVEVQAGYWWCHWGSPGKVWEANSGIFFFCDHMIRELVLLGGNWFNLHNNCHSEILLTDPSVRGYLLTFKHYNTFVGQRLGNQVLSIALAWVFSSVFLNPRVFFHRAFCKKELDAPWCEEWPFCLSPPVLFLGRATRLVTWKRGKKRNELMNRIAM